MPDEHPVRTSIIGSAVGGIIVAAVLWAAGYLGTAWRFVGRAISSAWEVVAAPVSVPVGVVVLVVAGCVLIIVRQRRWSPAPAADVRFLEPEVAAGGFASERPRELDRIQKRVMKALAEWDGDTPTTTELAEVLDLTRLRVEQAVERLQTAGLVLVDPTGPGDPVVGVTSAGRDYLIDKRHA